MASWQTADSAGESFQGLLLRHRGRTGLTQRDLATRVGISMRSVQDWEAGVTFPSAERLQALMRALLEAGGLTAGRETSEARELWAAAEREAPRMHTPFDEEWFARLLAAHASPTSAPASDVLHTVRIAEQGAGTAERAQDWGEAPDTTGFVGRNDELALLRRWVVEERCRLVALLGMGGIGKTSLAARLAQEVAPSFERVYWRSLRNAPPVSDWLAGAIGFVSDQQVVPPAAESERLTALLQLLRARRCLLVLDNSETLFEPGQREGRYRAGMDGYGRLLRAIGETTHQSCLVLTSREAPPELALLSGVRELELHGLGVAEGQALLANKQLIGDAQAWLSLMERYGGNGLALKIVGETIRQLFDGDISAFLGYAVATYGTVFGGIRRLLDVQAERLSPIERDVLTRLAVEREPVSVAELSRELAQSVGRSTVVEAIETLRRRSLVERGDRGATFTLQSMVLEYVTARLVETVTEEIERGRPLVLVGQPLIKAQAKEYVRQTQERLIGVPILQQLNTQHGADGTEPRLLALLDGWRGRPVAEQGYGPGNVVNLLRLLRGHLRRMDLSRLALRHAYLAEANAQDASLAGAHLAEAVLGEAFDYPTAFALSAAGALLAAGTTTGEVRLWSAADRTLLLAAQGHTGAVWGLAFSGDGRSLASGGADGLVRLWEAPSGRPLATLQGHTGLVCGVAFSADGRLLASGGVDGAVRLWEPGSGELLAILHGHTDMVRGVAFSGHGRLLASGSWDGTVRLWEAPSGRPLATLQGQTGGVRAMAVSGDGQRVASGGMDGTVRLWEPASGQLLAVLQGHTGAVWGLAFSGDGRLVASGGGDGLVRLWEAGSGRPLATLQGHTGLVVGVAFSGDGQLVASGGGDGTVRLWELGSGQPLAILHGHTGLVHSVALSADGQLVASGGGDGTVRLWEPGSGQPLTTVHGHTGPVWGLALSGDGRRLASGGFDEMVRLWETPSGRPLATLHGHSGLVWGLAFSADRRLLASGGVDGMIRLWEAGSGRLLATLHGHTDMIRGVAFSGDGRLLATSSVDGTARLWEPGSGQLQALLQGHTGPVYGVALSGDGGLVASGGGDGTVRLWESRTGQLQATLQGHIGAVYGVALSGDGRLVASCGVDGTVRLWGAGSGRCEATLQGHTGVVWGVGLSGDGQLLVSGGSDGMVRLWEASSGTCLRTLQAEHRYERMDITGLTGVTEAQRAALLALGAVEQHTSAGEPTVTTPL